MSRIGRLPISIPSGVDVKIDGQAVAVKGPKGELSLTVASPIEVAIEDGQLLVTRPDDERASRSLHGLTRTLIANQIIGVNEGYSKGLEVVGNGYRVKAKGSSVEFAATVTARNVSTSPVTETSADSLMTDCHWLPRPGRAVRSANGAMMRRNIVQRRMPVTRAASSVPGAMA